MIIAFLPPERQFLTCFLCSRFKQFRLQLFQEKRICKALINEDVVEIAVRES